MQGSTDCELLFADAIRLVRARNIADAMTLLGRVIDQEPRHHASLHLLGRLAGGQGDDRECVTMLERAVSVGTPAQAAASSLLLAAAHERAGREAEAEVAYRAALACNPASLDAHLGLGHLLRRTFRGGEAQAMFSRPHPPERGADFRFGLGLCLFDAGRHEAAVAALREAVALRPGLAAARAALATVLLETGDVAAARTEAERAAVLAPADRDAARNLAIVLNAGGAHAEAAAVCRRAMADGEEAGLLNTLGVALREDGRLDEAEGCFTRAVALRPDFVDALYNLASAHKEQGRTDEAVANFRQVVDRAPHLAAARFALCAAHLPPVCRSEDEIERRLRDYGAALHVLADCDPAMLADGIGAAQPFLLPAFTEDGAALQRRYGRIVRRATLARYPDAPLEAPPRSGEKLRLGIVCGFIRDHSVWRMPTRGWVEGLDRDRFGLISYHTGVIRDAETARATELFDCFREGPRSIEAWRETIMADRPHALIYPEIGMDRTAARLAAMRLAPVQYASWGHPITTGYPTIDFFLSSDAMEPADAGRHYTERLVRLPGLSTSLAVPPPLAAATRASLDLPEQAMIFWCGQSLHKFAPRHDGVFGAIAERVPKCLFLFVEHPGSRAVTRLFHERLVDAGLDREACRFLPRLDAAGYDAAMGTADVFLDPIGWSGCNTLVAALARDLAVVTCPRETMRSRHAAAFLERLGEGSTICATPVDYVSRAVALARDRNKREAIGRRVRAKLDLLKDEAPVKALQAHLLAAVATSSNGDRHSGSS